jgi:hypothetical protein
MPELPCHLIPFFIKVYISDFWGDLRLGFCIGPTMRAHWDAR